MNIWWGVCMPMYLVYTYYNVTMFNQTIYCFKFDAKNLPKYYGRYEFGRYPN